MIKRFVAAGIFSADAPSDFSDYGQLEVTAFQAFSRVADEYNVKRLIFGSIGVFSLACLHSSAISHFKTARFLIEGERAAAETEYLPNEIPPFEYCSCGKGFHYNERYYPPQVIGVTAEFSRNKAIIDASAVCIFYRFDDKEFSKEIEYASVTDKKVIVYVPEHEKRT